MSADGHDELPIFSFFNEDQLALRYGGSLKMIIDLASGTGELFDLATDPTEQTNIAGRAQHKGGFLQRTDELRRWKARTNQVVAASKQRKLEKRSREVSPHATLPCVGGILLSSDCVC